jgi:molybdate transport system ATP-binding protein
MAITCSIKKQLPEFTLQVSFSTDKKRIGILGASGSGKSMTLKAIAGIEPVDEGEIVVEGRTLFSDRRRVNEKPQSRSVGYLFQNYALFPHMSVAKNIGIGLRGDAKERNQRIREMLVRFRLEGLAERMPGELSGGQQQRVALARIMAYEPDIILLDEPFAALDAFLREQLLQELMELLEDYRGTALLVSHDRDEIYRFAQELLVLDRGRQASFGDARELFLHPGEMETARLTGCKNIVPAQAVDAHHLEVPDWDVTLRLEQEIPEDIRYIGIRAHMFEPVWGLPPENAVPFVLSDMAEYPFE